MYLIGIYITYCVGGLVLSLGPAEFADVPCSHIAPPNMSTIHV